MSDNVPPADHQIALAEMRAFIATVVNNLERKPVLGEEPLILMAGKQILEDYPFDIEGSLAAIRRNAIPPTDEMAEAHRRDYSYQTRCEATARSLRELAKGRGAPGTSPQGAMQALIDAADHLEAEAAHVVAVWD